MAFKGHARCYAQAIFEIALERKELDKLASDLESIALLGKDASINAVMENPKVSYEVKIKILSEPLSGIAEMAMNLVKLLVIRGRFNILPEIVNEFQYLYDDYRGIAIAEVITATQLTKEDEAKISQNLATIFAKNIVIAPRVDPSLIGGVVVRVNGKIVDGSVITTLASLKSELSGASR